MWELKRFLLFTYLSFLIVVFWAFLALDAYFIYCIFTKAKFLDEILLLLVLVGYTTIGITPIYIAVEGQLDPAN